MLMRVFAPFVNWPDEYVQVHDLYLLNGLHQ